jgi:hypothetical protein
MCSAVGAWLMATLGCGGVRASSVPLGGEHLEEPGPARAATSSAPLGAAQPTAATGAVPAVEGAAEQVESQVSAQARPETPPGPSKPAPGAFQIKPYATGQAWTRSFDLELSMKVGPAGGVDMRMVSHQVARFEVLAASAGQLDKLAIEYSVYTSKLSMMGSTQDSPEEVAGKRYVITFPGGKPEVKTASGSTPSKKELDTVKDDAREPLEMITALKELGPLAAKGHGDFSAAGAVALAGGEDEDTKVSGAKAGLRQLSSGASGEKSALLDLSYVLTNAPDLDSTIEAQLKGTVVVLDAPARYQTVTLSGPLQLRSRDADGAGHGTTKITLTYKY